MRVTNYQQQTTFTSDIQQRLSNILRIQQEMGSGRSIFEPSEDTERADRVLRMQRGLAQNSQFQRNIDDGQGWIQAGDDALKWFARILSSNMKGRDTVARYGGEEFAIILPQTTLENATLLAGQIRQQLQSQLWCKPGAPNTSMRITASFGVAQLADGEGTSGLQQRADKKLYESKTGGRNRIAA